MHGRSRKSISGTDGQFSGGFIAVEFDMDCISLIELRSRVMFVIIQSNKKLLDALGESSFAKLHWAFLAWSCNRRMSRQMMNPLQQQLLLLPPPLVQLELLLLLLQQLLLLTCKPQEIHNGCKKVTRHMLEHQLRANNELFNLTHRGPSVQNKNRDHLAIEVYFELKRFPV